MAFFKLFIPLIALISLKDCSSKPSSFYEENDGYLAVEAEHFDSQELDSIRQWYVIDKDFDNKLHADVDEPHFETASGSAYLEVLPDTRTNHDEELIAGENFSNEAGKLAILNYQVYINNPGKYYVWVRAYSTGTEDNGIHVGIDGTWPLSGQRIQWCDGKNQWTWESK